MAAATGVDAQQLPITPTMAGVTQPSAPASSDFVRDRNVSVAERVIAGYEPYQERFGSWLISPNATASANYLSNVFATDNNVVDDFVGITTLSLQAASDWNRNALSAYAQGIINSYANYTTEDTNEWQVGAAGRLDLTGPNYISGNVSAQRLTEDRTEVSLQVLSVKPIQYNFDEGDATASFELNRLKLRLRVEDDLYAYDNGRTAQGELVREDTLDRNDIFTEGRADYALTPDTALFASLSGNWRDYRLTPPAVALLRNAQGFEVSTGANFDLSKLARGEVGIGYIYEDYKAHIFSPTHGLGLRGKLELFPTGLTTVTLGGSRSIEDSELPDSADYLATIGTISLDHELYRFIVLSASVGHESDQYQDIDRQVTRTSVGASVTYKIGRRYKAVLGDTLLVQSSSGVLRFQNFTVDRLSLSFTGYF